MQKFWILFLLINGLFSCRESGSENIITGSVIEILDGDTFDLLTNGDTIRVRLLAIDCPERMQHFYLQCKDALSKLCMGKTVKLDVAYRDRWDRYVGKAYVNRMNINETMIKTGYAWHFTRYSDDQYLAELEQEARRKSVGIWSNPEAIPPWMFRDRNRKVAEDGR